MTRFKYSATEIKRAYKWYLATDSATFADVEKEFGINRHTFYQRVCRLNLPIKNDSLTRYPNLVGERFGKCVVLKRNGSDYYGHALWLCSCDCGNQFTATSRRLKYYKYKGCTCEKPVKLQAPRKHIVLTPKRVEVLASVVQFIELSWEKENPQFIDMIDHKLYDEVDNVIAWLKRELNKRV